MTDDNFDDDLDFASQMKGVKPLKTKAKVTIKKDSRPTPGIAERRQAATVVKKVGDNPLSVEHLELVLPSDVISYAQSGVARDMIRRLKMGDYSIDAKLDLHHKTIEQARVAIYKFIQDCQRYDARLGIILHGKGENGDPPALLKSFTNKWLKQIPEVLAFHSAKPFHGGTGAAYVLVKKSDTRKQQERGR